jgi:hypothetical protein
MADLIVQSFNAGVFAPNLDGRSDLEKYYSACRVLDNMFPTRYGPADRRPGTYYVGEVKDNSKTTRLLPFKYSTVQSYILEAGDEYLRFYRDRGQILGGAGTEDLGALDNIIAHWLLNDDTTNTAVLDDDGNTHDGIASVNTDVLHADAQVGTGSFDFDGTNVVTMTDHADFTFVEGVDGDFSIAGWAYVKNTGAEQVILSKWDETIGSQAREWKLLLDSSRKLKLCIADESLLLDSDLLIAHWKLNDSAANAVVDDATGSHDGTLADGDNNYTSDHSVAGKVNNAFDLDGSDDSVKIDDHADFRFGDGADDSPFSISAWINMADATDFPILCKYNDSGEEWRFRVGADDKLVLNLHDDAEGNRIGRKYDAAALTAQQGSWIHVVATYDATEVSAGITLYLNGTAVDDADEEAGGYTAMHGNAHDVYIGLMEHGGNYAEGKIDNVMVFGRELTAPEVTALYNDGDGIEELNTVYPSALSDNALDVGWRFVAVTYNGQNDGGDAAADDIIMYVDGIAVDVTATNLATYSAMEDTGAAPRMGAQFSAGGVIEKVWADKLDNIALFGDVLSASEIASLYSTSAYEITSPYSEDDLFGLQRIQSADVMYSFHSGYNPRKLSRLAHNAWELDSIDFDWPPFMTENGSPTTITPSATAGTVTLTATSAIFAPGHVDSYWLIKHNRTNNNITKKLTDIATLIVLGDAADSYAAEGVTDILVDVKGSYKARTDYTTNNAWIGTLVLERSYNGLLTLVLDAAPASGAWAKDDIITGATSEETCVIVSATDTTHYTIKQLSGSFTDGEVLSNQDANSRDTAATWPRYEGWHILETVQSAGNKDFIIIGEEESGDAYLRMRRTVDTAGKDPTVTLSCERFYHYGIVRITSVTSATAAIGTTIRAIGSTSATKLWSEGSWSDERGYPSSATFHEERLMTGGTTFEPHSIKGSRTDDWENFRTDSILDDDSISYSLAANEMNAVRWLISKEVLLLGTAGAEWKLGSFDTDGPLTPGNPIMPRIQTTYGSKDIQAIMLANIVLFVQSEGKSVRGAQYIFDRGESGGYDAPDYTTLANHITKSGVVSMAYQQQPEPVLWCVLGNGNLIGMTFEPGEKVWGWFNVVTDGLVEDVAVIPGVSEDEVWIIVNRTIDGDTKRYVEYFMPRDWGSDQADCFFVDSGLTFDGGDAITITGITKADPAVVTAVANGYSNGDQVKIIGVPGMVEINNKVFTVASAATDTVALKDKLDSIDWSTLGSDYTAFESSVTGDVEWDSYAVTNVSAADIAKLATRGTVTGTGIPSDTTITAIGDDTFTMSKKGTATTTAVTITVRGRIMQVENAFFGLDHLEGKTVSVLGDGSVHDNVIVSSGAVTLTDYYNKVHIGLPYKSKVQPMKLTVPGTNIRGKAIRVHEMIVSFDKTLGARVGLSEGDTLLTVPFRKVGDITGEPPPLFTGEKSKKIESGYRTQGDVYVEQDQPLPMTVRSITARLKVYG